jgi:sigma-B regulation protein RsbU (phosphoserine phosphatase)
LPPSPETSDSERALFDGAACGLMQTDRDGTFLRANRTFCNWLGYRAEELVLRRKFQELLTVGGRIFHQTHWLPLLEIQGSISEVKLELRHQDGSTLPMVVNAILRGEAAAKVQDIAAFIARDRDAYERELVRSRKRLEELVAESNRLHEEARDRALFAEQMIGIVSHDLRNPVSAVQMGAALLERKVADEDQRRIVGRIDRASKRANRLITDLLDFTQARLGGGLRASLKPIDLHATVREAVEDLALANPGRQIRTNGLGDGACQADSNRLVQLVGNLVSNAVTYGAEDQPITVTSEVDAASASVTVHNFGPPISAAALPTLFEPMSRATNETSAQRSVGLGLFIVRQIAASHAGTAHVESNATAGTSFRVQFPR